MLQMSSETEHLFQQRLGGFLRETAPPVVHSLLRGVLHAFRALRKGARGGVDCRGGLLVLTFGSRMEDRDIESFAKLVYPQRNTAVVYPDRAGITLLDFAGICLLALKESVSCFFSFGRRGFVFRCGLFSFLQARILLKAIERIGPGEVCMFGHTYLHTVFFLGIMLRHSDGCKTSCIVGNTVVLERDSVLADRVMLNNRWYKYNSAPLEKMFPGVEVAFCPTQEYLLTQPFSGENRIRRKRIAVYSSGMHLRDKLGFHSSAALADMQGKENQLREMIGEYAAGHSDVQIVVFPHPSESRDEARAYWVDTLGMNNVVLSGDSIMSRDCYDDFELGVANNSTVIIERLERGHKALFVFPAIEEIMQPLFKTPLCAAILRNEDDVLRKLDEFRVMSHREFFNTLDYPEALEKAVRGGEK